MIQRIKSDIHLTELLKGSAINIIFKVLSVAAQYLLILVIARYYEASGVGIFSIVWTVLQVVTVFSKLGFDTAIVKLIATYFSTGKEHLIPKLYRRIAFLIVVAAVFYSGLLALNSVWLSNMYFESMGNSKYILIICLAVLPLSLQYVNADAFKALKQFTLYSAFQNGSIFFLSLIFIVLIHQFYPGIDAVVYGLVSAVFVLFISSSFIIRKVFSKLIKNYSEIVSELKFKIGGSKSLLKMSLPMMLSNSLFLILNWTDTLMLGAFVSDSQVGIYTTALKVAALNAIVLVGVNSIAMPKYAELNACSSKDSLRKFIKNTTLLIIMLSIPVLLVIFIFPETLLGMFGAEFKAGVTALLDIVGRTNI